MATLRSPFFPEVGCPQSVFSLDATAETCASVLGRWQRGQEPLAAWPLSSALFQVERKLGRGCFAAAYSATRTSEHEQTSHVALKVVPRFTKEASRELEVMLRLRESSSVGVAVLNEYFFLKVAGADKGGMPSAWSLVMVLPQFDCNLCDFLARTADQAPRLQQAQAVGRQLAAALSHVHALGIAHRDIKPDNILVRDQRSDRTWPSAVLADFGHAKYVRPSAVAMPAGAHAHAKDYDEESEEEGEGEDGDEVGSNCAYAFARFFRAPELFYGCSSYTFAPDVWALGCVIAEVLLDGVSLFVPPEDEEATAAAPPLPPPIARLNASQRQLLHVFEALGTPSYYDVVAMGIALDDDAEHLRRWMRVPPRMPTLPWQTKVQSALDHQAAKGLGGRRGSTDAKQALELLGAIFKYAPTARPTAEALLRLGFLCEESFELDAETTP